MDIGIDLGTANIIITRRRHGVVLNEPSVIAFNKRTERVVAVGEEAYKMEGRSPRTSRSCTRCRTASSRTTS